MYGISPKLPLMVDDRDGPYALTKTLRESVKQNFKHLLFTVPGERVMDMNFGVGLRRFLFENMTSEVIGNINAAIRSQADIYLPFVDITNIDISQGKENLNRLNISISYSIADLGVNDVLLLPISNTNSL